MENTLPLLLWLDQNYNIDTSTTYCISGQDIEISFYDHTAMISTMDPSVSVVETCAGFNYWLGLFRNELMHDPSKQWIEFSMQYLYHYYA